MKSEGWPVVGFCPHVGSTEVFEKICVITLDPTSWSIKEVIVRGTKQSDYIALTLSLSHRSLTVGVGDIPRGMTRLEL